MRFVDGYRVSHRGLQTDTAVARPRTHYWRGKKNSPTPSESCRPTVSTRSGARKLAGDWRFRRANVRGADSKETQASRRQHGACCVVSRGQPPFISPIVGGIFPPIKRQDEQNRQFLRSNSTHISRPSNFPACRPSRGVKYALYLTGSFCSFA